MNEKIKIKQPAKITGTVRIKTYVAGTLNLVTPYIQQLKIYKKFLAEEKSQSLKDFYINGIENINGKIKAILYTGYLATPVENHNLIMQAPGYGLDLIIQRLIGNNTYSLNIQYGEIGTGNTAPAVSDIALTTPTNRAIVSYQQDYAATTAIVQFFFTDAVLANTTYYEVGCFVDGNSTIGTGQIFDHALLSPAYTKVAGTDVTLEFDFGLSQ